MFNGANNAEMLWQFMDTKGKFSSKLLRRAAFADNFISEKGLFIQADGRTAPMPQQPTSLIWNRISKLMPNSAAGDERMQLLRFKDLLEKALVIDPQRRLSASEALEHPFFLS